MVCNFKANDVKLLKVHSFTFKTAYEKMAQGLLDLQAEFAQLSLKCVLSSKQPAACVVPPPKSVFFQKCDIFDTF